MRIVVVVRVVLVIEVVVVVVVVVVLQVVVVVAVVLRVSAVIVAVLVVVVVYNPLRDLLVRKATVNHAIAFSGSGVSTRCRRTNMMTSVGTSGIFRTGFHLAARKTAARTETLSSLRRRSFLKPSPRRWYVGLSDLLRDTRGSDIDVVADPGYP